MPILVPDRNKINSMYTIHGPSLQLDQTMVPSLPLFFCLMTTGLQPACVIRPIPALTNFNPEDGGSMFHQNASICLKDYTWDYGLRDHHREHLKTYVINNVVFCYFTLLLVDVIDLV
jgi:hypothetical protein